MNHLGGAGQDVMQYKVLVQYMVVFIRCKLL